MKNVIAITTWRRPEFLYIYLLQILKNKTYDNYKYLFCVDVDFDPQVLEVINQFKATDKEIVIRDKRVSILPAAYNILDSYLLASDRTKDYVIIGEEDIIPSEDFLRFCEYSYNNILSIYDRIFCIAHKRRQDPQDGKSNVLIGDTQCTSPFVLTKKAIDMYMRPELSSTHIYSNPHLHNMLYHDTSRIRYNVHCNHDGVIERIIEKNKLFALKPDQARTAHVGAYGGPDISKDTTRPWLQKANSLLDIIFDNDSLKRLNQEQDNRGDLKTEVASCSLKEYEWDHLLLDTDRVLAISSSWWYDPLNDFKKYIDDTDLRRN